MGSQVSSAQLFRIEVRPIGASEGSALSWTWTLFKGGVHATGGRAETQDKAKRLAQEAADEIAACDAATERYEYVPQPPARPQHWKV